MITRQQFIEFLKREGVLKQYVRNCVNGGISIRSITGSAIPQKYIIVAFGWALTPEGLDFWKNIDDKWQKELYNQLTPLIEGRFNFSVETEPKVHIPTQKMYTREEMIGFANWCIRIVGRYCDNGDLTAWEEGRKKDA